MPENCFQTTCKLSRRMFKNIFFRCFMRTHGEGIYNDSDSLDQQELVGLMNENVDHPFDEEIKVIVHKYPNDN